jgi:hypothetical protein
MRLRQAVYLSDGTIRKYEVIPEHKPLLPYKRYGALHCDGRLVGEFVLPRHMKESEDHHCLISWIVSDNIDPFVVGVL